MLGSRVFALGLFRPLRPNQRQLVARGDEPLLGATGIRPFKFGLGARSLRGDFAGGRQQMLMVIARIALAMGLMNREVHGNSMAVRDLGRKRSHQFDALHSTGPTGHAAS